VLRFFDEVLQSGNPTHLDGLVNADYQPHVADLRGMPRLESGREVLRNRLIASGPRPHRVFRAIVDDDLVFAQTRYDGDAPIAGIDIFRFGGDDDLIAEHWNIRQPIGAEVAAGFDRFTGDGDPDALITRAQRERQKRHVRNLYSEVWSKGQADLVASYYTAFYIQHNPHIESGSTRIKRIIETDIAAYIAKSGGDYPIDIHLLGCEGDLVFAYCSITMAGLTRNDGDRSATVDIFRIDAAGRLVLQMESESLPDDTTYF
jgi:predicted SnoaL-like aldol condensation-catalyzing enzyme